MGTEHASSPSTASGAGARHASPTGNEDLSPQTLARTLRAVAAELERDPALARRVASAIAADPTMVTGDSADPSTGRVEPPEGSPDSSQPPRSTRRHATGTFTPTLVTGINPDLGPGIPDPFALARRLGPDGLCAALAGLRRGTLRAMIREYGIAPAAQVARITDDVKLRELIVAAALK